MKRSRSGWDVLLCTAVLAGCASSSGGAANSGTGGEGAASRVSRWPTPATYEYRPESPNIGTEAMANEPPAWFMAVALLSDANSRESIATLDRTWATHHNRAWLLRQKLSECEERWAWERENKKAVIVPREVTSDLQADHPPAWIRSVPGAFIDRDAWARGTEDARQRELESIALQEARFAYQDRTNEHSIHQANHERLARLDADKLRQSEQQEAARQREEQARDARTNYERLQAEKLGQVEEQPVRLEVLLSGPAQFKGRTILVRGHWRESVGRGMHLDALGGAPVLIVGVTPPDRREPQAMLALDLKDYQDRITFFEPLPAKTPLESGARVELTVFVLGDPLDSQAPCIGRILATRVE